MDKTTIIMIRVMLVTVIIAAGAWGVAALYGVSDRYEAKQRRVVYDNKYATIIDNLANMHNKLDHILDIEIKTLKDRVTTLEKAVFEKSQYIIMQNGSETVYRNKK